MTLSTLFWVGFTIIMCLLGLCLFGAIVSVGDENENATNFWAGVIISASRLLVFYLMFCLFIKILFAC